MKKTLLPLFLFALVNTFAQTRHKLDSLLTVLASHSAEDTLLAKTLNETAYGFTRVNPDSSKIFADRALSLSTKLKFKPGIAFAYNTMGVFNHLQARYAEALEFYGKAKKIKEEAGDKKGMVSTQNNMGIVYYLQGQYDKALKNYVNSLQIQKTLHDTLGMAATFNYIASVHYYLSDYEKALGYYLDALGMYERVGDKSGIAQANNNVGIIYSTLGNLDKAIENYNASLDLSKQTSDRYNMASAYNNLGSAYQRKKNNVKALEYFNESLKLAREINNVQGIAYNVVSIGNIYEIKKDFVNALKNYREGLSLHEQINDRNGAAATLIFIANCQRDLRNPAEAEAAYSKAIKQAQSIGAKDLISKCYEGFARLYKQKNDFKRSYEYLNRYAALRDTLLSEEKNRSMAEMQTRFDTDKKEKEIALLTKNKDLEELRSGEQQANLKKQRVTIYASLGGISLALTLAFFVLRGYSEKKKANLLLEEKNEAISKQKQVLEEKNMLITDSIDYAKNIQEAILPDMSLFKEQFTDSFVLFKPKDIVSGDFYWLNGGRQETVSGKQQNTRSATDCLLAAIDCVGHGVPGAFMALHSYNLLEQIVKEGKDLSPADILDMLNKKVLESLNQQNETSSAKHGMDLALVKIKGNEIAFAGARNPLVVVNKQGELTEIKADRMYVGGAQGDFTNQQLKIEKGCMLYLFTDGYADQKGGPQNKKFFAEPLRALFKEIAHLTADEQKNLLEKKHLEWKGYGEQIDDILIIGVRV